MTLIAPETARRVFRGAEPIHGMIYFTPFGAEAYAALGFTHPRMGYFASRSAPMGAVAAEVTIATFFNFNPELVHAVLPEAWTIATPEQILTARLDAVDRSLRKAGRTCRRHRSSRSCRTRTSSRGTRLQQTTRATPVRWARIIAVA